ncbi:hypothetical protein KYK31_01010 [Hymenobacter norwichensis]|nr:hypothetical protein [Hymenobacter norwichensis]
MKFFPVCQLDTTDILASLRKAEVGLSFSTSEWYRLIRPTTYGQVQSPFKEKTVTLTTNDPIERDVHCWDCGLNDRFIIPVSITLSDTLDIYPVNNEIYNYTLKTKQGNFSLRFRSTSQVEVHEIKPI